MGMDPKASAILDDSNRPHAAYLGTRWVCE
jgi:hypothetical protein